MKPTTQRRGQLALEYVATYGWVFLLITITLTILFSTGVFNFNTFKQDDCFFPTGVNCEGSQILSTGPHVHLLLINEYGTTITLNDQPLIKNERGQIDTSGCVATPTTVRYGEVLSITCTITGFSPPVRGDYVEYTMHLNYSVTGENYEYTTIGRVRSTVQ